MVNARPQPRDPNNPGSPGPAEAEHAGSAQASDGLRGFAGSRFNVLLTEDRPRLDEVEHWTIQLPRLLEPQGVASYLASSGREAIDLAGRFEFHAAVIDLATPVYDTAAGGGIWLLDLLGRMPNRPPIVVINSPAYSHQRMQHTLREALRLGAFAVVDKPIDLNELLAVLRKVVDRQYKGTWPL